MLLNHHTCLLKIHNLYSLRPDLTVTHFEPVSVGLNSFKAGGKAHTHTQRILDIQPDAIHQRVAVILGAANEVDKCLTY